MKLTIKDKIMAREHERTRQLEKIVRLGHWLLENGHNAESDEYKFTDNFVNNAIKFVNDYNNEIKQLKEGVA